MTIRCKNSLSVAIFLSTFAMAASAEEKKEGRRIAEMTNRIMALKAAGELSDGFSFRPKPLMRYSDPTRAIVDATVWAIGEKGRPQGIVVLERYENSGGRNFWSYELTVTSEKVVESLSGPSWNWRPSGKGFVWKDVPADAPGDTKIQRGRQIKELARSFRFSETFGETYQLRLMPQPLLKYADEDKGVLDGSIFILAHGTNAELLLVLEARKGEGDTATWKAGFARLGAAPMSAIRNESPFWNVDWWSPESPLYMFQQDEIVEVVASNPE